MTLETERRGSAETLTTTDRNDALCRAERSNSYDVELPTSTIAVYDGRALAGWVADMGERYAGVTAERRSLGLYNTATAARNAVWSWHVGRRG